MISYFEKHKAASTALIYHFLFSLQMHQVREMRSAAVVYGYQDATVIRISSRCIAVGSFYNNQRESIIIFTDIYNSTTLMIEFVILILAQDMGNTNKKGYSFCWCFSVRVELYINIFQLHVFLLSLPQT